MQSPDWTLSSRGQNWHQISPSIILYLVLQPSLLRTLGLTNLDRPTGQQAPGILPAPPPRPAVTGVCRHTHCSYRCAQTHSLLLQGCADTLTAATGVHRHTQLFEFSDLNSGTCTCVASTSPNKPSPGPGHPHAICMLTRHPWTQLAILYWHLGYTL